jgi:formate-dependent nitrite reductase cytochrome c552 subunit
MPHRKIVEKLTQYINENSTAAYFHGHEDVVCQGCHHQSPAGEKPPLCGSCHAAESADLELMKPALKGAYHRQCLGCHQSMDIQKPEDCSGCHAEKDEAVQTAASSGVR